MKYTSVNTFDFHGVIQIDRSGVGHNWQTVHPDDLRADVMESLCNESSVIEDGARCSVGGMAYRAVEDKE